MIVAETSSLFEARVEAFPTGLTGTVGVRVLDDEGGTTFARTAAGISENPAGSGSYIVTLSAPGVPGSYSVFWDWDGAGPLVPSHTAAETLMVTVPTSTVIVPAPGPLVPSRAPRIPHLSLPFRLEAGSAAVVEQDSVSEIVDCCQAILRCPQGHRVELPEFGRPDQVLSENGADPVEVQAALDRWEPRARAVAAADPAALTDAVSVVTTLTSVGGTEQ